MGPQHFVGTRPTNHKIQLALDLQVGPGWFGVRWFPLMAKLLITSLVPIGLSLFFPHAARTIVAGQQIVQREIGSSPGLPC